MDLRLAGFSAEALEGGEFPNSSYGSPLFFLEHLCFFFWRGAFGFGKPLPKNGSIAGILLEM